MGENSFMGNKEDKFFGLLRQFAALAEEASQAVVPVLTEEQDPIQAFEKIRQIKRDARELLGPMINKMHKIYHDPIEVACVKGIIKRFYGMIDSLKEIANRMAAVEVPHRPEEIHLMGRLIEAAFSELRKVVDYTVDVESNYMKMEARCSRIYAYEEKGDEAFRSCYRELFDGSGDAVRLVFWKEILESIEEVLDQAAGMVPLLQRVLTHF